MTGRRFPVVYPTKIFAGLIFVLGAMWYAAASQNNAAIYLLLFATVGILLVCIPQTVMNLTRIRVSAESIKPAFAGREVAVPVEIRNESRQTRRACVLSLPDSSGTPETVDEITPGKAARVTLRFRAETRGEFEVRKVEVRSSYPLGFLSALRSFATHQRYVVYPAPAGDPVLPHSSDRVLAGEVESLLGEGDDYAGVRAYVAGESQRHIDWKAVARGQPLMTKQFTAEADDVVNLDFAAAHFPDVEQKLSQLALWIIEAERARRRYSLRMPDSYVRPSSGDAHYHRCLSLLATHR